MKVVSVIYSNKKPRIRVCHDCGRKLYGNHHAVVVFEGVNHEFVYHKECAKLIEPKKERREW